jgi:hypothetical protein
LGDLGKLFRNCVIEYAIKVWEWAIDQDVSDGCDFGNRDFCLYSLLFTWDQA